MIPIIVPSVLPQRQEPLGHLLSQLAEYAPENTITVLLHKAGDAPSNDVLRAFDVACKLGNPWVIYIEDDAFLGPAFTENLSYLDKTSAGCVSFFSTLERPDGVERVQPSKFCYLVCCAINSTMFSGFREFAEWWYKSHPKHKHAADFVVGAFCSRRCIAIECVYPSAVQHKPIKSTLGNRSTKRQSPTYARAYGGI